MPCPVLPPSSSSHFDDSLSATQAHSSGAAEAFLAVHGDWVARTAAELCRRLGVPEQDYEDILQETYRRLLDPQLRRFTPSRGGGKHYVHGVILNAIDYGGRRRRRARNGPTSDTDEPYDFADYGWQAPFDRVEARADLPKLLRGADTLVSRALELVCANGLSQREAAYAIGISEFNLSRAIRKFSALARVAA